MFRTQRLNNEVIVPPVNTEFDVKRVKGYQLFPEAYANIFCCARKQSGKSSTIFHILKKCTSTPTKLWIFCGTHDLDDVWVAIKKWLDEKGIEYECFKSIHEGKEDILKGIMDRLREPEEEPVEPVPEPVVPPIFMSDEEEARWHARQAAVHARRERKRNGKSKIYPKNIFVLDDLSTELKSPSVVRLLKENRHFKSKVIISSQSYKDLAPGARNQFQYVLIFKGIREDVLQLIHQETYINIEFDEFYDIYEYATKQKYNFLYIDLKNMKFRKNFNEEIRPKATTSDDDPEDQ